MKTCCLVCKKLTGNTNLKNVKDKGGLMMKSICLVCGNKNLDLLYKDLDYLIV